MESETATAAPPAVLAVVVVHDPGEWFEETLAALAAQDHPNLRFLIVDTGSRDPTAQVAHVLPEATVHHLDGNPGFGAAVNVVLQRAEALGAAEFLLLCHDDIAPEPGSAQALVETARAFDAGIVAPKLVDWDDPQSLLQVGAKVDKAGMAFPLVERGERDQGQHDSTRDVFEAPGAFTLVRADLFARLGGFDEAITWLGDDLSLCWRAHLVGARVVTTSVTRVRHREALGVRLPVGQRRRLAARHRLRAVLTSYGLAHLLRVVPQLVLLTLARVVLSLVSLQPSRAGEAVGAWWWNLCRPLSLWRLRRRVAAVRRASDSRVRQGQAPGLVHPLLLAQRAGVGSGVRRRALRDRVETWCAGWTRGSVVVLLAVAAVLVLGSRHLLTRGVPAVGDFAAFPPPGELVQAWLSRWRTSGLGSDNPAPTVFGALGAAGALLGEEMGVLRVLVTVGLLPVGLVGAARALRPTGSRWAPVVATVAYAAVPVPYAALAAGRWDALAVYAATPWLLGGLARTSRVPPFVAPSMVGNVVALGLVTGLLALVVPGAGSVVLVLGAGLAAGSLLAFDGRSAVRLIVAAGAAAVIAGLLHLPWTLDLVDDWHGPGAWLGRGWSGGEVPLPTLLGLSDGTSGPTPWSWGLLAGASLALLVGRGWRAGWAARAWLVAASAWTLAAVAGRGPAGVPLPPPDVFLAVAGAALALAVGLGAAAVELDVRGRSRRFGLRRSAVALATVGVLAATIPVLRASLDGYWHMPRGDFTTVLGFVDGGQPGASRMLWMGAPELLPAPGWSLPPDALGPTASAPAAAFAITEGLPSIEDLWPGPADEATARLAHAVELATSHQTTRLGRLLAPMAVGYVAVPLRRAPAPFTDHEVGVPPGLVEGLAAQLDLERIDVDPGLLLFRNLSALPARAAVAPHEAEAAVPVLDRPAGHARWTGNLPADVTVLQSVPVSDGWNLDVGGRPARRTTAFGWANAFEVGRGGPAVLQHDTPTSYHVLLAGQVLLWAAALALAMRLRRRSQVPTAEPRVAVPPPPPRHAAAKPVRPWRSHRRARPTPSPEPARPPASTEPVCESVTVIRASDQAGVPG